MGPKKPAVSDLAAVAPSEDELKEAREALKKLEGAELKRQKANMAYWLKSRGQEKSAGVRGEDRLRWLEEYLVLKAREKNASRTTSTSHNYAITTKKATKKQWWNKVQLESKLGVERTATLINSGKMQTQACPITGVDDEHNRLYKHSFEEEKEEEKDSLSTALTTNADIKESELDDAIGVMQSARDCMQGTFSVANIKTEPEAQQTEREREIGFVGCHYTRKKTPMRDSRRTYAANPSTETGRNSKKRNKCSHRNLQILCNTPSLPEKTFISHRHCTNAPTR